MTWAIWGKTRTTTDDDVIHTGATDVRVDFEFSFADQTYRVIRSRQRGGRGNLEFQILAVTGYKAVSYKGLREAQGEINKYIKIDYDTFINSAYLRQGRADQFMLLKPNERKVILANLLKLDQYEELAKKAQEEARQHKQDKERLKEDLKLIKEKIAQKPELNNKIKAINTEISETQLNIQRVVQELKLLQEKKDIRQQLVNQWSIKQQEYNYTQQNSDRLGNDYQQTTQQLTELAKQLQQESNITTNYQELLNLKNQERILREKLNQYDQFQQQKQQLEQQIQQQRHQLELKAQTLETRLDSIEQEEQEITQKLSKVDSVREKVKELQQYRQRLQELDRLHQQVTPLQQRRDYLEIQIQREKANLDAELQQLEKQVNLLTQELAEKPKQIQALQAIENQLDILDKKTNRLEWVKQKIQEKNNLETKLKERIANLNQEREKLITKRYSLENTEALCPLCEQNLGEHHLHQVINKTATEEQKVEAESWTNKEEIVKCQRERQDLTTELTTLEQELIEYKSLQQKHWNLETQLDSHQQRYEKKKEILAQIATITESLEQKKYADNLFRELTSIKTQLQSLNYDEKTHGLVREKERGLGWVEKQQLEIERAEAKQQEYSQLKPQLIAELEQIKTGISALSSTSPLRQQIEQLILNIAQLNYDPNQYKSIISAIDKAGQWELSYQKLQQAKQAYPQQQQKLTEIEARQKQEREKKESLQQELNELQIKIDTIKDTTTEINTLEKTKELNSNRLQELLPEQGRVEEQIRQIETSEKEQVDKQANLKKLEIQHRVYDELSIAFSKKGIQSLMIENIIPYLEAQTNQILARLTSNQLHVKFETQKANKTSDKVNETLDINISDSQGTRPYETYSGGEAFRINFAIRLALSKLLAQRAGTSLQLLVIDEGFGTQDQEGCERLIAAINAIAADFECILTVTHMQQFKEAFQTHIEVRKTKEGSQLRLSSLSS
jgi:exonuclease SbcC